MKPDVTIPPAASAEAMWVEGELVRNLMRSAQSTQLPALLIIPVFMGVLWHDTATGVLLWAPLAFGMAMLRYWVIVTHAREARHHGSQAHLQLFRRYRFVWGLSGFTWGLATALFFDRVSIPDQFICWLMMAGLAMFSINSLSSHLPTMRAYLSALAFTSLAVIVWKVGFVLQFQGPSYHYWLVALLLIFWSLLRQAGFRLHITHRRNFELQFRNSQLIESLTRQTQAALDAVDIKNRFLASAAHDIRQPVHALGLYADWLGNEPDLVHEIAPKIVDATKAVNALFDSLFDLVRLDSGKIKLNIEPVDLAKLLRDLELQYRPLAKAKGLEFRVRARPGYTISDPILLQRILGNLISNAVKYTRQGGILITSRSGARGDRIEIWDTGVGIAPVHQREIFREFFKVPSHAGTEDSFGLGLYIVGRLTHILGHPLTLTSRPGRGSVFRLVLVPTNADDAAHRAASPVAQLASMP